MANYELQLEFEKIFQLDDCFDVVIALKQLNKKYKKSDFYKQTKYPIKKAYELYVKQKMLGVLKFVSMFDSVESIGNILTACINNIDPDVIAALFDKLSSTFNVDTLKQLQGEVTTVFNQFKHN